MDLGLVFILRQDGFFSFFCFVDGGEEREEEKRKKKKKREKKKKSWRSTTSTTSTLTSATTRMDKKNTSNCRRNHSQRGLFRQTLLSNVPQGIKLVIQLKIMSLSSSTGRDVFFFTSSFTDIPRRRRCRHRKIRLKKQNKKQMGKTEKKYGVAHAYYFLVAESGHAARDDVPSAVRDKARA